MEAQLITKSKTIPALVDWLISHQGHTTSHNNHLHGEVQYKIQLLVVNNSNKAHL